MRRPDTEQLLNQLPADVQERVGVVVDAIAGFPAPEGRGIHFTIAEPPKSRYISFNVEIGENTTPDTAPTLLTHIHDALAQAGLTHEIRNSTIAQPFFLGKHERPTTGRALYINVGSPPSPNEVILGRI